jgi:hypothetical protein
MNKLTTEQIKFIDDYLYNAGVRFADIRFEMTDHAATAIEVMDGDFGQNFYAYMASHKRELLAGNKKFKKEAIGNSFRLIKNNLLKPYFLGLACIFFLTGYYLLPTIGFDDLYGIFIMISSGLSLVFIVGFLYYWFGKERYSVIDKLFIVLWLVPNGLRIEKWIDNEKGILIYFSLYMAFMAVLLFTVFQLINKYKRLYHA